MNSRARTDRSAWIPFLLAVLAYLPCLGNGFVWDDGTVITGDAGQKSISGLGRALTRGFGWDETVGQGGVLYYRPLVTLLNTVTWAVSGGRPWLFHLENIAAHAAAAALVTLLGLKLGISRGAAVIAGACFALHPVATEPVAWISGRADVLVCLISLLTLLFWKREALAGIGIFLALCSKETAIGLPVLLAFFRRGVHLVLPVAIYLALRFFALGGTWLRVEGSGGLEDRLLAVGNLVLAYVGKMLIPWPLAIEPPAAFHAGSWPVAPGILGLGLLAALIAAWILVVRRRDLVLSIGLGILLLGLAPALRWLPGGEVYGERFLYLPMAGVFLLAGRGLAPWLERRPRLVWGSAALVLAVYLGLLERRLPDWKDDLRLYASAARARPENTRALANYGSALAASGQMAEARRYLVRAVELDPRDRWARSQYGAYLLNTGAFEEAAQELDAARSGGLRSKTLIKNLAVAWTRSGRYQQAVDLLAPAMAGDPNDPEFPDALGTAERNLGHHDEAEGLFKRSISLDPTRKGPWMNLIAMLAFESRKPAEASSVGAQFLERFPHEPEAAMVRQILSTIRVER